MPYFAARRGAGLNAVQLRLKCAEFLLEVLAIGAGVVERGALGSGFGSNTGKRWAQNAIRSQDWPGTALYRADRTTAF